MSLCNIYGLLTGTWCVYSIYIDWLTLIFWTSMWECSLVCKYTWWEKIDEKWDFQRLAIFLELHTWDLYRQSDSTWPHYTWSATVSKFTLAPPSTRIVFKYTQTDLFPSFPGCLLHQNLSRCLNALSTAALRRAEIQSALSGVVTLSAKILN